MRSLSPGVHRLSGFLRDESRVSEPTRRSICLGLLVLCLAFVGMDCERSETGAATSTVEEKPDRWVRRFLPPSDRWLRKSELSAEPQEWPRMVIWEVSSILPGTKPTEGHKQAATDFVERCYAAAERNGWFDFEKGMAGGFEAMPDDNRHFRNEEFVFDDRLLDPERPEFLMYYPTPENEHELAGFMFFVRSRDEVGPSSAAC